MKVAVKKRVSESFDVSRKIAHVMKRAEHEKLVCWIFIVASEGGESGSYNLMSIRMSCNDQIQVTLESILELQWRHFQLSAVRFRWREFAVSVVFLSVLFVLFRDSEVRVLFYYH